MAGVRTTYGSAVFADHFPSKTAAAVRLLEAAGWVDVGKTNLHEFAYGVTSQNVHYGVVPNPALPGRTAGGSIGGSARGARAGLGGRGPRHGHGRLDPHPGRLLRHRRVEADVRARPDRRRVPARAELRPCRPDGERCRAAASS